MYDFSTFARILPRHTIYRYGATAMYEFITEKTLPEYEAYVQSHPTG